jgi:hypothetical protein
MKIRVIIALFATIVASASAQSYRLDWLSINSGGLTNQVSANYGLKMSCAQSVTGYGSSTNYRAWLGFWHQSMGTGLSAEEIQTVVLPLTFRLEQNYPNPFNPSTTIEFALPHSHMVRLVIYNELGQLVRTLVAEPLHAGAYRVQWDGRDFTGSEVASGIYLYRLSAGVSSATRKMLLVK